MRKTPQQQPTRDEASEKSSAEKLKDVFALLGLLRRRAVLAVRFRYGLLQLRAQATLLPLRGSRFWRRMERVRKVVQGFGRRFRLSWGLALCAVVMAATVLLSALVHGAPELRGLEGTPLPAESLLMLDPNRKDETMLTPGNLYDRPVAAVQTGTQSLLLRARLEETLLTIRRDENGLVVVPMPTRDPGENYSPRTVTEEAALHLLAEAGLCPKDATWAAAKAMQLPQSRLPATAQDAKILVFEKKTVENPIDSSIDLASLLPEDWDQFGVNKTTYTHMGFYDCGGGQYQPLYVVVEEPPKGSAEDPVITKISYQFYAWDVTGKTVHLFGEAETEAVRFGTPELHPLSEWEKPTKAWFYDEDGWVYYGDILKPGEMTPLLLANFYVLPDSPLAGGEENRYRLLVRPQSVALDLKGGFEANRAFVLAVWNTQAELFGLGTNQISQTAANFSLAMLKAAKLK